MDIPKTKTVTLCDAERYAEGLKQLARECNLTSIRYCKLGVQMFSFADGSEIGVCPAFGLEI